MAEEPAPGDFDAVFRRYASYVSTILYRLGGQDDEIEDLVQDVFLDAFRGLEALRDPAALKGWLAVISTRRMRRHLRARRLRQWVRLDKAEAPSLSALACGPTAEHRTLLGQALGHVEQFPVDERIAWCLRHLEQMTIQEVSASCEWSLSTTKRRLSAAEHRLQKAMEP